MTGRRLTAIRGPVDIKEEVFVRFQREARAAGTIDSQHIVRIFDMGTDERSGSPYMVMERLSDGPGGVLLFREFATATTRPAANDISVGHIYGTRVSKEGAALDGELVICNDCARARDRRTDSPRCSYECKGTLECPTECAENSDCADGATCDMASKRCVTRPRSTTAGRGSCATRPVDASPTEYGGRRRMQRRAGPVGNGTGSRFRCGVRGIVRDRFRAEAQRT